MQTVNNIKGKMLSEDDLGHVSGGQAMRDRVMELEMKEITGEITDEEKAELELYRSMGL